MVVEIPLDWADSDDDQMLIYYLKSVWSDPGVQRFIQRNQHDQELQSARYTTFAIPDHD